jgi:hypothetical protein
MASFNSMLNYVGLCKPNTAPRIHLGTKFRYALLKSSHIIHTTVAVPVFKYAKILEKLKLSHCRNFLFSAVLKFVDFEKKKDFSNF